MISKYFFLLVLLISVSGATFGQGTDLTYQGQLQSSSALASGTFDFEFALFDSVTGGSQLGSTLTRNGVAVSNGIFSVNLDFGNLFPGAQRFLEIRVREGGGAFTTLSPRQPLSSSPYAVKSINSESATIAVNAITANNATTAQTAVNFSGSLGGDVTGNQSSTTVARLRGRNVATTQPSNGQVLKFNTATSQWEPAADETGGGNAILNQTTQQANSNFNISGNGTAGGTLSGNAVNTATQFNLGGERVLTATNQAFGSVYLGFGAGTNGLANTFVGYQAGQANSTQNVASANSFFGRRAGASNTDGGENAFFGSDTGDKNTTGAQNSFFGRSAGTSVTDGNQNSFFGRSAGLFTTTGGGNTFIGANSGFGNTTGSNNSVLGSLANLAAGVSFGTAIGSGATVSQSNSVVLGRALDTVRVPGSLDVSGSITGNFTVPAANITGVLAAANGGTGLAGSGASGNFLRSTGTGWTSGPILAANIPAGSGNYIQNQNAGPQSSSNFSISGTGTAQVFDATDQYNINGERILFRGGISSLFVGIRAGNSTNPGSGGQNSFFGYEAGFSNNISVNNAFFGANSGRSNTATGNSFFGSGAGFGNTTGERNSSIGFRAGADNTTGSNNTFIGHESNPASGNLSYATAIGALSSVSTSNTIALGRAGGEDLVRIPGTMTVTGGSDASLSGGGFIVVGEPSSPNLVIDNNEIIARNAGGIDTLFLNADGGDVSLIRTGTGNVGIAIAGTPQDKLHVDGIIRVTTLGAAGATSLCRNASQQISTCSSSLRYKTNFSQYGSGLDLISRLKPITFDWKDGGMHDLGLGAEDVAAIEPLLVTYNAKGEVEGVKYDRIGVVLVNAVKEQQRQIEQQTEKIKRQQQELDLMKTFLCGKEDRPAFCGK